MNSRMVILGVGLIGLIAKATQVKIKQDRLCEKANNIRAMADAQQVQAAQQHQEMKQQLSLLLDQLTTLKQRIINFQLKDFYSQITTDQRINDYVSSAEREVIENMVQQHQQPTGE